MAGFAIITYGGDRGLELLARAARILGDFGQGLRMHGEVLHESIELRAIRPDFGFGAGRSFLRDFGLRYRRKSIADEGGELCEARSDLGNARRELIADLARVAGSIALLALLAAFSH